MRQLLIYCTINLTQTITNRITIRQLLILVSRYIFTHFKNETITDIFIIKQLLRIVSSLNYYP